MKYTCILCLATFALMAVYPAAAQDDAAPDAAVPDDKLEIRALNAGGYDMACGWEEYSPERIAAGDTKASTSWRVFGCGEPLGMFYNGPLSDDNIDPLNQGVCEGVDPAVMAAMVNYEFAVRMPPPLDPLTGERQPVWRCPFPLYPHDSFYSAELPGPCLVVLRLPADAEPAEVYAEWRGTRYDLQPTEALKVARWMMEGEPSPYETPPESLEGRIAWLDTRALIAYADNDTQQQALLFDEAEAIVADCVAKYRERHGEDPADIAALVTVPGAVAARLPCNPYAPDRQLGLDDGDVAAPRTFSFALAEVAGE